MRKVFAAVVAVAAVLRFAAPAGADPALQGKASAFGLAATGAIPVSPTPSVAVDAPDAAIENTVLNIPAPPLALSATLTAQAAARIESSLDATLPGVLDGVNARGFAATEDLGLLFTVAGAAPQPLVGAQVLQAEAVARCEGGRAVFDTGSNIVGLTIGGQQVNLGPVLNPVLDLLGPGGPLQAVVTVVTNETGTLPGGGVFVNALRISIPVLNVNIVVSHAEARMTTPCGVPPAAPDEPVAAAGPGGGGDLPRTGSNEMLIAPVGLGMLATAVVLRHLNRRARRSAA